VGDPSRRSGQILAALDRGHPEKATGQRYAVDSWSGPQGENPAVVKVEDWYIKDINNLPKATY
jgi:hypothetical protein